MVGGFIGVGVIWGVEGIDVEGVVGVVLVFILVKIGVWGGKVVLGKLEVVVIIELVLEVVDFLWIILGLDVEEMEGVWEWWIFICVEWEIGWILGILLWVVNVLICIVWLLFWVVMYLFRGF